MISLTKISSSDTPNAGRVKINDAMDDIEGYLGPNNAIQFDQNGFGSMMVFIPRFDWDPANGFNSSTIHPAFVVNGVEKSGFWVSKYQCVLVDSNGDVYDTTGDPGHTHNYFARSIPGVKPRTHIDFDSARRACTNMNGGSVSGWHLMSNAEWAAVALWCQQNSCMPKGNNNYGRDIDEKSIIGEIISGDTFGSGTSRWKTGSGGPFTSHDGTPYGIFDLNGNLWEWVDGFKLNEGKIYVAGNLNSSPTGIGNSFESLEANWYDTGMYVNWDGASSTITFSNVNRGTTMQGASPDYKNMQFDDIIGADDNLKKLCIGPVSTGGNIHGADHSWWRNFGERLPFRAGNWNNGTTAGVFCLDLSGTRTNVYNRIGVRAALVV